jgi:hypothetical protein
LPADGPFVLISTFSFIICKNIFLYTITYVI